MRKYVLWGLAWIISQQLLAMCGIIAPIGLWRSVVDVILSIVAVRFVKKHEWFLGIVCVVFIIWFAGAIFYGELISALVSLLMNIILLIIAFSKNGG